MRITSVIAAEVDRQRGHLFPWLAVLLGCGVGTYFLLATEPSQSAIQILTAATIVGSILVWRLPATIRWIGIALLFVMLGFLAAATRAHMVAAEKLEFRYYGPIQGRIVAIDRSQSDAVRLTLDQIVLADVPYNTTPKRVRISMHGPQGFFDPEPGQIVATTGHLSPPGRPVEPGGFDFQRHAWFLQIGAVGYTRNPVLQMAEGELTGFWLRVTHLRLAISSHIVAMLPGRTGAFAAAVTTGDRSGMDQETLEALRASNLAHLLAISGLHMGLLSGFVFAAVRVGLSLFGTLALRWPVKKVAALCGLAAASVYLLLSGGNVATERAFIQVGVMFLAVLADRRAITLRAVALAALIVLVLRPESLLSPGFQMSFAATTALVATYSWLRDYDWQGGRWSKTSRFIGGVALTSFVAGMATAPFAAAHFNQVPHYGLIANILSVPVMGMIVIPGAVLAACLAPIGLEWIGLAIMSPAINWILLVASEVSELPRSLSHVPSPSPWVLPTLSMGCLWFVIWRGRLKFFGAVPILAAFFLWSQVERPQILISETGGLMGVLGEGGRILTKAKGEGFAASSWLENDGDAVVQVTAHERLDVSQKPSRLRSFDVAGVSVVHATGNKAASVALANCEDTNIVVVNVDALASDHCQVFDKNRLAQTGAIALYISNGEIREQSARAEQGTRLWSQ